MFKEKINIQEQKKGEEKMKNTKEFRQALDQGFLAEAEEFLSNVQNNPENYPNYDSTWLDHRQRELFQAFYKIEDWKGAKRVIEVTEDPQSKVGRIARLEELSGLNYDEI